MNEEKKIPISEIHDRITEVKAEFVEKYGIEIDVLFELKDHITVVPTLVEIEECANAVLKLLVVDVPKEGIRSKKREKEIVTCRQIFCFYALQNKYGCLGVGRYLGIDHATVLHGRLKVSHLIETKDPLMTHAYSTFLIEFQKALNTKLGSNAA